ncbi:hypothetical protein [Gorillibacterium massiliense]|uniref:hypothetical protein n=1 Tax=Gorillibacterium massiliense TaxID=1280390 RepID=UPI001EE37C81|nr:hypothetical protein [Gorillibacterium massiliense]
MENEILRIEMIPGIGAKIVSMQYKPTGREWLLDAGTRKLNLPAYGSPFGQADMSGWDECFPTVDPCYADERRQVLLPDHGEVWPLPWEASVSCGEDAVTCTVEGVALPYRLSRTLSFTAHDALRMDYRAENCGSEPLPFLWVPHPQFAVPEPTDIVLPPSVQEVICVFGGLTQTVGCSYPWAEVSRVTEGQTGDGRKIYVPGIHQEGWCGLVGQNSGDWLWMKTDPALVPYLGIWIDEGLGNDRNAIALEPSIGYFDRLDRARYNGTAQMVMPGESWEWSITVLLGTGIRCRPDSR